MGPSAGASGRVSEVVVAISATDLFFLIQFVFYSNPRVRCDQIPSVDLSYFKEDPINGGFFPFDNYRTGTSTNNIDYM